MQFRDVNDQNSKKNKKQNKTKKNLVLFLKSQHMESSYMKEEIKN